MFNDTAFAHRALFGGTRGYPNRGTLFEPPSDVVEFVRHRVQSGKFLDPSGGMGITEGIEQLSPAELGTLGPQLSALFAEGASRQRFRGQTWAAQVYDQAREYLEKRMREHGH
jgi:hypothetical protein